MRAVLFIFFFWVVVITACVYAQREERTERECYILHNLNACDYLEELNR